MEVITTESVKGYIPPRDPKGDKYSFGKVLCIAGSVGYTGAPYFASIAAQKTGCGLVRLIVPETIWEIEATKLNEVMVIPVSDDDDGRISQKAVGKIMEYARKADAVLVGPGCGINRGIQAVVKSLLTTLTVPLVIDADGINVLCEDTDMLKYASCPTVVTPHAREFARLFGKRIIPNNKTLQDFAIEYNTTIVYKEAETRIASADNTISILKNSPCSGMAKGGSGDVLAGIITSLIAQGLEIKKATITGVYIHNRAGLEAEKIYGERGMLPTNIIEMLPRVLKNLENKKNTKIDENKDIKIAPKEDDTNTLF